VLISIQDTGVGMPEHVREHLFEPFFTTQDVGGGSGLGMASVYGTVTQMGGDITVDSSPGEGTTFRILLPTAAKAAFETHDGSAMGKMHLRKTRETILLVHDAPKARATTKHMLDLLGYSTLSVGSLKEALQQLSGHSKEADLAIIDTGLPNMTGRQFLTELAAQGHELPGLLIKSKTAADTVTGQDMVFLRAPFDRDMLEDKIREALGDTD
jgi:CheY-like chemotaxis protein